jgi:mRNA interferase MazF
MKRGEVRWYKFQQPDKTRPVVILTRTWILSYLGEVTVVPVTRTIREIPSQVILSKEDGMPGRCAVNCDHVQTISKGKVGPLITTLGRQKMREIANAIIFALGMDDPGNDTDTETD